MINSNGADTIHYNENNDEARDKVSLNINSDVTFARNDIQEYNENGSTNLQNTLKSSSEGKTKEKNIKLTLLY